MQATNFELINQLIQIGSSIRVFVDIVIIAKATYLSNCPNIAINLQDVLKYLKSLPFGILPVIVRETALYRLRRFLRTSSHNPDVLAV